VRSASTHARPPLPRPSACRAPGPRGHPPARRARARARPTLAACPCPRARPATPAPSRLAAPDERSKRQRPVPGAAAAPMRGRGWGRAAAAGRTRAAICRSASCSAASRVSSSGRQRAASADRQLAPLSSAHARHCAAPRPSAARPDARRPCPGAAHDAGFSRRAAGARPLPPCGGAAAGQAPRITPPQLPQLERARDLGTWSLGRAPARKRRPGRRTAAGRP